MWCFALSQTEDPTTQEPRRNERTSLRAYSAYDLPSVAALVRYLHVAAGFPTKHTWLKAIKSGNPETWLGLTYSNASKYFSQATETIKVHMTQTKQGLRSTKAKPTIVKARAHAPQNKVLQQPEYTSTRQQSEKYTLMVAGASQLNQ